MVEELLERLMLEERTWYLAEHPTKANGYSPRDLLALTGPGENLQAEYGAEMEDAAKETLRQLDERWGTAYPCTVVRWKTKAYALLAFLQHPRPIRRYLYTI